MKKKEEKNTKVTTKTKSDKSKKETKKQTKKKKENIFVRIKKYFVGVKKEAGRIRWTSPKDLLKYSIITILFIIFLGIYFYLIDVLIAIIRSLI